MANVLIVDDHVAMRSGLRSVLRLAPSLDVVDAVADGAAALAVAGRARVDAAIVDYQLSEDDGLHVCRALKKRVPGVRVVIYSGFAGERLSVAAVVAGADAVLGKGVAGDEVIRTLMAALDGQPWHPDMAAAAVRDSGHDLSPGQLALLDLRLAGASEADIAEALGIAPDEAERAIDALVAALRPRVLLSRSARGA